MRILFAAVASSRPVRVRRSRAARELARPTSDRWAPTLAAFWATNAAATAGIPPLRPVRVAARQVGSAAPCASHLTLLPAGRRSALGWYARHWYAERTDEDDSIELWRKPGLVSGGQLL